METKELIKILLANLIKEANNTDSLAKHTKLLQLVAILREVNDMYEYINMGWLFGFKGFIFLIWYLLFAMGIYYQWSWNYLTMIHFFTDPTYDIYLNIIFIIFAIIAVFYLLSLILVLFFSNRTERKAFFIEEFLSITSVFVKSLSLKELVKLSMAKEDRVGFIKDYYDFKHKNISTVVKGITLVIIANLAILLKNNFDKTIDIKNLNSDGMLFRLTVCLIIFNIWNIIKLNQCVKEFSTAVKIYTDLKL